MSKSKTRSTIAGLLLIAIILISGTFAFQQFNQGAFNPAFGDELIIYGGRIHDDFENVEGAGCRDKDIFAENFGNRDLFVRIQLREFLLIGGGPPIGDADINDPSTWPIFQAEADNVHSRRPGTYTYLIGEEGISWTLGNADNITKIFMPTHNHVTEPVLPGDILPIVPAPFNNPNAYRFSNTTGAGVEQIAGGFNITGQTGAEDILNNGFQTGASISDGTHDFWSAGATYTRDLIYINNDGEMSVQPGVEHVARPTLVPDEGGVMTLTQWNAAGQPAGNFWILDTEDPEGWFYWNGYLPAGEATSLLLNGICIEDRHESWEYVIFMNADFFTRDSIDDLPGGISSAAREIFEDPAVDFSWLNDPDYLCTAHDRSWNDTEGVAWCVLELANVLGQGGYGNALIITVNAIGGVNHNSVVAYTYDWFYNNGASELRNIGTDTMIPPIRGISLDQATGENTLMIPNSSTVGYPRAFPLSRVEAEHHLPNAVDRATTDIGSGNVRGWWLRSAASLAGNNMHGISGGGSPGNFTFMGAGSQVGTRPALWVQYPQ